MHRWMDLLQMVESLDIVYDKYISQCNIVLCLSIGTNIGPLSSSYEAEEDADPYFRRYCCPNKAPSALLIIFVGENTCVCLTLYLMS